MIFQGIHEEKLFASHLAYVQLLVIDMRVHINVKDCDLAICRPISFIYYGQYQFSSVSI